MHIVLYQPEIPPNTGNIARLCAGTQLPLHLIEPLGFSLDDKYLKRAGLDYWPHVNMRIWPSFAAYLEQAGAGQRLVCSSARAGTPLQEARFTATDSLIFGPETRGLPEEILALASVRIRIPIFDTIRSLNLATAVGIVAYHAMCSNGLIHTLP